MRKDLLGALRVIDLGHALAGPFSTTLLADFGADVIKVERPGHGDAMRDLGPKSATGPAWWKSVARNKRSIGLDWKNPKSRPVFEKLVRSSHVLVENFRPGVMERNSLGPDVLHRWNSDLVILRISGYGQTGPYVSRPGFGKAGEAMSGLCDLTGFPDGAPTYPGFPMADATTGLMGAFSIMMVLYGIATGACKGQIIDLPLYETPLRLIDYHIPVRTGTDVFPKRNGNRQPMGFAVSGTYKTKDGKWVTHSAATSATAKRLVALVGGEAWANDLRFSTMEGICAHDEEIDKRMAEWMGRRSADEIIKAFNDAQAVAAYIYDVDDILKDPHIAARQNIVSIEGEPCKVVNVVPHLSDTPGRIKWLGRTNVGEDTEEILRDVLGLDDRAIQELIETGAAGSGESTAAAASAD